MTGNDLKGDSTSQGVGVGARGTVALASAKHDRIGPDRKRTQWTLGVCLASVVATAIWSFSRTNSAELPRPAQMPSDPDKSDAHRLVAALNTVPFESAIWRPLQKDPLPSTPPPPPPIAPLRVALLGIDHAPDGKLRAVVYDHQSDIVLVLRSGDSLRDRVLRLVSTDAVEFVTTKGDVQRLTMQDTANAASPTSARRGGAR